LKFTPWAGLGLVIASHFLAPISSVAAARTEVYWCPIKHARRALGPHPHYQGFADFGDAEAFRAKVDAMQDGVTIEGEGGSKP
jgi:hypothetical protein